MESAISIGKNIPNGNKSDKYIGKNPLDRKKTTRQVNKSASTKNRHANKFFPPVERRNKAGHLTDKLKS